MDSQPECSDTHCTPSTGFYSLARRSSHTHLCTQLSQPAISPYSHLQFPIHTMHRDANLMYKLELSRMVITSWPKGRNVCFWDVFWVPSSLYSGRHEAMHSDTSCTKISSLPCVQWDWLHLICCCSSVSPPVSTTPVSCCVGSRAVWSLPKESTYFPATSAFLQYVAETRAMFPLGSGEEITVRAVTLKAQKWMLSYLREHFMANLYWHILR